MTRQELVEAFAEAEAREDAFLGVAISTENGSTEYRFYEPAGFEAAKKAYFRAYDGEGRGKNGSFLLAALSGAYLAGTAATLLCAARREKTA